MWGSQYTGGPGTGIPTQTGRVIVRVIVANNHPREAPPRRRAETRSRGELLERALVGGLPPGGAFPEAAPFQEIAPSDCVWTGRPRHAAGTDSVPVLYLEPKSPTTYVQKVADKGCFWITLAKLMRLW